MSVAVDGRDLLPRTLCTAVMAPLSE